MNLNKQNLINKIKYRAQYRGTKEMDKFVKLFVKKIVNGLDINELENLNRLINLSDEEILNISYGKKKVDISDKIIKTLIDFKKKY